MSTTSVFAANSLAKPADVRAWLEANGFPVGSRGKFSVEGIKAYNKANSRKYKPASFVQTKEVIVRDKRGKRVQRKIVVRSARQVLKDAGETVGLRGRLSPSQIQRAVELA